MELLYIWVEDYKNIKQKGFNFSPLHDFHFKPTNFNKEGKVTAGKLTDNISKEEQKNREVFYKDFFGRGKRINNITAIIGENGVGKSSIIEIIANYYFEEYYTQNNYSRFVFVYAENIEKQNEESIKELKYLSSFEIESKDISKLEKTDLFTILYSITHHNYEHHPYTELIKSKEFINQSLFTRISQLTQARGDRGAVKNGLTAYNVNTFLNYIKNFGDLKDMVSNHFRFPHILEINFSNPNINILTRFGKGASNKLDASNYKMGFIVNMFFVYIQEIESSFNKVKEKIFFEEALKEYNIDIEDYNSILQNNYNEDKYLFYNKLSRFLEHILTNEKVREQTYLPLLLGKENLKILYDFLLELPLEPSYLLSKFYIKIEALDYKQKGYEIFMFFIQYLVECAEITLSLVSYSSSLDKKDNYISLSSGEQALLSLLSNIAEARHKKIGNYGIKAKKTVLLLIDEGELGLHPQWQKRYLSVLIDILPKIFLGKEIQLILTSHSPFLVSDLPKENIILLEKSNEGLSEIASLEKEQTFGQNITTLFSDSFFLSGGVVGDFALDKINDYLEYLKDRKFISLYKAKEVNHFINLIGDKLIRTHLRMKLEKVITQSDDETQINFYQSKIDELKKRGGKEW